MADLIPIRRALISVSNKQWIDELARALGKFKVEIISTGNTAKAISDAGVAVLEVSDFTGFPEMLDGRLKTLHPKVHGGILGIRDDAKHAEQMAENDILPIDLVVVNLYPFAEAVAKSDVTVKKATENIDIGGPAMLRSAAKNYEDVAVICDPYDYDMVIREIEKEGGLSLMTRYHLSKKVFEHTGRYDLEISRFQHTRTVYDGAIRQVVMRRPD